MLELEIAKIGAMPTYIKGEKSSIVDLTFLDPVILILATEWSMHWQRSPGSHIPALPDKQNSEYDKDAEEREMGTSYFWQGNF